MKLLNPGSQVGCTPDSVLIYPESQVRMDLQRTRSGAGEMFARKERKKDFFQPVFRIPRRAQSCVRSSGEFAL